MPCLPALLPTHSPCPTPLQVYAAKRAASLRVAEEEQRGYGGGAAAATARERKKRQRQQGAA